MTDKTIVGLMHDMKNLISFISNQTQVLFIGPKHWIS